MTNLQLLKSSHKTAYENSLATNPNAQPGDAMERLTQATHDARGTMSKQTERTYANGVRNFVAWCDETGRDYGFPYSAIDPVDVAAFIDDRAETHKPASVAKYVTAVNYQCVLMEMPQPSQSLVVRQALIRMRKAKGTAQKQAEPIVQADIWTAIDNMGDGLRSLRDTALMWVAFDSMCRASELVALRVKDIKSIGGKHSTYVSRSKTDQTGQGDYRYCSDIGFAAVLRWVKAAELTDDMPLFRSVCNSSRCDYLIPQDVSRIFKRRLGKQFSAHSSRVGAAIKQLEENQSMAKIMSSGGWKSPNMVLRYVERSDVQNSAAAELARRDGRSGKAAAAALAELLVQIAD